MNDDLHLENLRISQGVTEVLTELNVDSSKRNEKLTKDIHAALSELDRYLTHEWTRFVINLGDKK